MTKAFAVHVKVFADDNAAHEQIRELLDRFVGDDNAGAPVFHVSTTKARELIAEYEAEHRARQEAEAQAAALREALEWALEEGGFDLWYYADESKIPPILDTSGGVGSPAAIKEDAGKQYLAIVEAARQDYEAAKQRCQTHKDEGRCKKPPYNKCTMPMSECPLDHFGHLEEVLSREAGADRAVQRARLQRQSAAPPCWL